MFCKYCGKEIEDGKEVCEECASKETETKVEENVVIEEPKKENTNNETVKEETTTHTYVNTNSATETNTNNSTLRFARSMNLQKFTSTVKSPNYGENQKCEIPESEYIWNPPYLKKTQIFPSYVRQLIF